MSNHKLFSNRGFTLVEMLIVAPIVVLVIGVFISALVGMTGDVLVVRGSNALSYNIQDALNRIDLDVKASSGYLATNDITLTSPQGFNNDATVFHNTDATNGTMLILKAYATTKNPLDPAKSYVYQSNQPKACSDQLVSQNSIVMFDIVYFVKNVNGVNSLWRRVVAPSNYTTVGCSVPWQQPTCVPGYVLAFCKANDIKLVDGITSFGVNFYTSSDAVNPIANATNTSLADSVRQTAIDTASTVGITINATKKLAGRDISKSGTIRTTSSNYDATAWAYKRPITITNSSGGALTDYQVQVNPFADSNFINNTGLLGSWHFSEGTGTTTVDMSGNGNTGTWEGTGTHWDNSSKFGNGGYYNSSLNDGVRATVASLPLLASSRTIGIWFKTTGTTGLIMGYGSTAGGRPDFLMYLNSGKVEFSSGSGLDIITSAAAKNDNIWHQAVLSYDGTTTRMYVDGVLEGNAVSTLTTDTTQMGFGVYTARGDTRFTGYLDDGFLFNRALSGPAINCGASSANEICQRYGASGVPKVRGDYADIRFKDSTGATEYPYWQETDGKYWVRIPSLATGTTDINMYYGNPSAISSSSGYNTFPDLFASFETSIDGFTGITDSNRVTSPVPPNGSYSINIPANGSANKTFTMPSYPFIFEARTRVSSGFSYQFNMYTGSKRVGLTAGYPTSTTWGYLNTANSNWINSGVGTNANNWSAIKIYYDTPNNTFSAWQDGTTIITNYAATANVTAAQASHYTYPAMNSYTDYNRIRKYAATEPTHAAPGAEVAN